MISYLLKDYLVKLVEIDTLKNNTLHFFILFTMTNTLINIHPIHVFTLIVWQEDTKTNVNTGYNHIQLYK